MSLLNSDNKGEISWAIFWISALVSAELRLKKILLTRSKCCPEKSKAAMVFKKVSLSVESAMALISDLACSMACSMAGLKCSFLILENGAVSNGDNKGLFV